MSEKRPIKRIPIVMDLLMDDFTSPEQVNEVVELLAKIISDSKEKFENSKFKINESRFLVKDRILIIDNYKEEIQTKKIL